MQLFKTFFVEVQTCNLIESLSQLINYKNSLKMAITVIIPTPHSQGEILVFYTLEKVVSPPCYLSNFQNTLENFAIMQKFQIFSLLVKSSQRDGNRLDMKGMT